MRDGNPIGFLVGVACIYAISSTIFEYSHINKICTAEQTVDYNGGTGVVVVNPPTCYSFPVIRFRRRHHHHHHRRRHNHYHFHHNKRRRVRDNKEKHVISKP